MGIKDKKICRLIINDSNGNIFNDKYVVPFYQRAYAWADKEIKQLLDDLDGFKNDNYYIGTLIVDENNDDNNYVSYEVIDGQQRLTTLYLLLNYLEIDVNNSLCFKCRDKSTFTLEKEHIKRLVNVVKNDEPIPIEYEDNVAREIFKGISIINDYFMNNQDFMNIIKSKLEKVVLFRIIVPEGTDLNRYFETMNTRGEQLLLTDILKARLMSYLKDDKERILFAKIWDACSKMSGYIQMNIIDTKLRSLIFSSNWEELQEITFDDVCTKTDEINKDVKVFSFSDIISKENIENEIANVEHSEEVDRVRFESIINFDYFLLHTLYFINNEKNIKILTSSDDKMLLENYGYYFDNLSDENKCKETKTFIMTLLKYRVLFDKYIVKREYSSDEDKIGKWSIQTLKTSNSDSYNKAYYSLTYNNEGKNKQLTMIEVALRVSYTSPKSMRWIDEVMKYLFENCNNVDVDSLIIKVENCIKEPVKTWLSKCKNKGNYETGLSTEHYVFNCLDYALWLNDKERYKDFDFEFRNSVEHWYPRNPIEGSFDKWENNKDYGTYDRFGNLCLVTNKLNSKFSNSSPIGKKGFITNTNNSIKLRKMVDYINNDNSSIYDWKKNNCKKHEDEMIKKLEQFCIS